QERPASSIRSDEQPCSARERKLLLVCVELDSKPNPSDPDVKTSTSISDLHVNLYGDTALVSYKMTSTDTGHKDPALNATDHYLYAVGNACSLSEPLPQAEWNAKKKAMSEMPKDVQQAYH